MATRISPNDTFPNSNAPSNTSKFLDDINLNYSDLSTELKVYDVKVINNMIENILLTVIGERHYEPEFGSEIPALIYEPYDEETAYYIEAEIYKCLTRWMPYIDVDTRNTKCIPDGDRGLFAVTIAYVVKISGLIGSFRIDLVR